MSIPVLILAAVIFFLTLIIDHLRKGLLMMAELILEMNDKIKEIESKL